MEGFEKASNENNIDFTYNVMGSMFGFFFNPKKPENFADVDNSDTERYAKFHSKMLNKGFYFAPSAYETGFICTVMKDEEIKNTIDAYKNIAKEI